MASLQFHATHFAGLFVIPDTLTLTHSLYFLLVLTAVSFRSFLELFQNGISYRRMFAPNHLLFLFVLPSYNFLDQSKIISEPWHSGSKGRMSIAGYLPKNRRTEESKAKVGAYNIIGWSGNL